MCYSSGRLQIAVLHKDQRGWVAYHSPYHHPQSTATLESCRRSAKLPTNLKEIPMSIERYWGCGEPCGKQVQRRRCEVFLRNKPRWLCLPRKRWYPEYLTLGTPPPSPSVTLRRVQYREDYVNLHRDNLPGFN